MRGLRCPRCGADEGVHVDVVEVAAGPEDAPRTHIAIDCLTAEVRTDETTTATGTAVGEGRRHRIALGAWCEFCEPAWWVTYTQHKGQTLVEIVERGAHE